MSILGKINKQVLLFVFIFIFALFLRFYQLGAVPSGFDADEAAWGYNAYSILKTGADEYGVKFPLILKSFGEYKGALYSYLAIPFIQFLDLTPLAVRLPSVLFSLASLIVLYFLTKELTKRKSVALLTIFLYAISPWSIALSRVVADFNLAFFFTLLLTYALLRLKKAFSPKWFVVALLSGILAIFSYSAARLYVIIMVLIFLCISLLLNKKKIIIKNAYSWLLILLLIVGLGYSAFGTTARFSQVSIFSTPETKLVMEEQIREDRFQSPLATRIFHNKVINYTRTFLTNYGQYFTVDYLFLTGGLPLRERIPNSGLFYIWQLPFLLLGIYYLVRKEKILAGFLGAWVFLLIIPSVITYDEIPNVHRSFIVLPPFLITISLGLFSAWDFVRTKKWKRYAIGILAAVLIFEFSYFIHQYFKHQGIHQAWYRGYAYQELVYKLNHEYAHYPKVYMTKSQLSPYIYILFYSKFDPALYQAMGSPRDVVDNKGFGRYIFIARDCPLSGGEKGEDRVAGEEKVLYVNKGNCMRPKYNSKLIDVINWKDNTPAFQLVEYLPSK